MGSADQSRQQQHPGDFPSRLNEPDPRTTRLGRADVLANALTEQLLQRSLNFINWSITPSERCAPQPS